MLVRRGGEHEIDRTAGFQECFREPCLRSGFAVYLESLHVGRIGRRTAAADNDIARRPVNADLWKQRAAEDQLRGLVFRGTCPSPTKRTTTTSRPDRHCPACPLACSSRS